MFRDTYIFIAQKSRSSAPLRSTRLKKNWKIFVRNKNFVIENSVHRTESKISIGSLFTTNVRRPIRGSDFRLSPISRSNHPGFYRVIISRIFFFFFHSKSGGTINAAILAGRRDLAIDLFFSPFANIRDFWLGAFPSPSHYSAPSGGNEVSEIRD